jgi:hypothetical protein
LLDPFWERGFLHGLERVKSVSRGRAMKHKFLRVTLMDRVLNKC